MQTIRKNALIVIFIFFTTFTTAQERCGTMQLLQQMIDNNPVLENTIANFENSVANAQNQLQNGNSIPPNIIIRIPVVFHVVYNTTEQNISDEQIFSQIRILNEDYRRKVGTNGENGSLVGADTRIEFYLANIDPVGNPTNGITRTQSFLTEVVPQFNEGYGDETPVKFTSLGGHDAWPRDSYLNIWVCNLVDALGTLLGYAQFPMYDVTTPRPYDPETDGVVLNFGIVGDIGYQKYPNLYDLGRTATHEIGHWLGLRHTWGDQALCGVKATDYVDDTPPCAGEYYAGKTGYLECGANVYSCGSTRRQIENYMDYSSDHCMNIFTIGQAARMKAVLLAARSSYLNNLYYLVDQIREDESRASGSTVARWETSLFVDYPVTDEPAKILYSGNSSDVLRADQDVLLNPNEKYYKWFWPDNLINHTTVSFDDIMPLSIFKKVFSTTTIKNILEGTDEAGGKISFTDPWLIDDPDPLYGNSKKNRGISAIPKERDSPFSPDFSTNYNGDIYGGVFLNQGADWQPPYYSVKITSPQPISLNGRTHTFYFQSWSGTEVQFEKAAALQTGVVFKDNIPGVDPIVSANYKGHLMSNSSTAGAYNGQRKIVRDRNGIYHIVYHSMNALWYSKTVTTNMNEWTPDEKLVDLGSNYTLVNPSIDINTTPTGPFLDDKLSIAYEIYEDVNYAEVRVVTKNMSTGIVTPLGAVQIDPAYFGNAKPAVASFGDEVVVVYKYSATSPLNCLRYYLDGSTWTQVNPIQVIPNTDQTSVNPTIASNNRPHQTNNRVQMAWQQGATIIRYQYSEKTANMSSARNFYGYNSNVSFGSGNTYNTNPSIVDINTSGARIVWQGTKKLSPTDYQYRTVFKNPTPGSTFSNYGSNSAPPSINKIEDNTEFVFGWGLNDGTAAYFADNTLSQIYPLNITGKDVQMCNGALKNSMYAMSFNSTTLPYFFAQSNDIQSLYTIAKANIASINKGREGVVAKGSGELYFTIGDVQVNGENIAFTALPDSFTVTSVNDINNNVRTIPFAVSDNSQFYYSVQYGITDSAEVVNSLSVNDIVSFRVEIVDEATNAVLGVFDNVSFTKQQAVPYENFSYQVSTEGIGNRTVYLRLVTSATEGCSFSLANLLDNQNIIAKRAINQISFKSAAVIKDYSLEQNYPNPFNPVTTITYQLPKSGSVTLKIFDILGNEVKTLVDENKEMGRYTVQFDASSLASGMYVYQLRANDYTSTKKMMLLK